MATHSPRAIVKVTSSSAGHGRLRAKRPALRSRRRNVFRRSRTSTAGAWRARGEARSDVDGARVDMLLLLKTKYGTKDVRPPVRRCADLKGAARPGGASA